jgi:hypothetical protein
MKEIEQIFESFRPLTQFCITCAMGVVAHLDTIASILAIVVLMFQFKVVFLNGKVKGMELKLREMEYEKECREDTVE